MGHRNLVASVAHSFQTYFIWLLLAAYALAGTFPGLGQQMRTVCLGEVTFLGEQTPLTLPVLMLGFLLFQAGLSIKATDLPNVKRSLLLLGAGLSANLIVPIACIFLAAQALFFWPNPDEVQYLLVGMALIAAMPVAGSSTAWSQKVEGNLPLSLGLVIASTFLSPLTTPLALHSAALTVRAKHAELLYSLAGKSTGVFLSVWVLFPSLLGIVTRRLVGEARIRRAKPYLSLASGINLLLLNYTNASISLPQVVAAPNPRFLAVILVVVVVLCALSFGSGWAVARLCRGDRGQEAALIFGLGMNNNGTGLVLASLALATYPRVMLPLICYNLVQHLFAGAVDFLYYQKRQPGASGAAGEVYRFPQAPAEAILPRKSA
jgi:BASS family bile acid:Na+ symporter